MKKIKVKFIDQEPAFSLDECVVYKLLKQYYVVELSNEPDYIIDGGLGHEHSNRKYEKCIKLVTIGENLAPDFNSFDYAVGFDQIRFGDRYLRLPLFAFYEEFAKLSARTFPSDEALLRRDFCSFVVSNGSGDPLRTEFFHKLSKYKPVASGGRYLNNIGGRVKDKNAFCAKFKFNIAFENSVSPGYTTEKVMQPYTVNTVPIYYGDPLVGQDFNVDSMIRVASRDAIERAIEEIVYLDTHDDAYLAKVKAPCLVHTVEWYEAQLTAFLRNIFDSPIEEARRLVPYGMQRVYRARLEALYKVDDVLKAPFRAAMQMKRKLKVWMA